MAEFFPNNLRHYRKIAGLTQQQLADRIGSTQNTISSLETGQWDPNLQNAYKLSGALQVPVNMLFPRGFVKLDPETEGQVYEICCSYPNLQASFFLRVERFEFERKLEFIRKSVNETDDCLLLEEENTFNVPGCRYRIHKYEIQKLQGSVGWSETFGRITTYLD